VCTNCGLSGLGTGPGGPADEVWGFGPEFFMLLSVRKSLGMIHEFLARLALITSVRELLGPFWALRAGVRAPM